MLCMSCCVTSLHDMSCYYATLRYVSEYYVILYVCYFMLCYVTLIKNNTKNMLLYVVVVERHKMYV